jgi:hypothetical protein
MRREDYIPESDIVFAEWADNFIKHLGAEHERFGIPTEEYDRLAQLHEEFAEAYLLATTPDTRTKPLVHAKDAARKALKKAIRQVVKTYIAFNPAVTGADREYLQLPIYKTTRTHAPVAAVSPYVEVHIPMHSSLSIIFFDKEDGHRRRAKPAGQQAVEIAWVISSEKPEQLSELIHSEISTRSPCRLSFNYSQRGKTIYFALRWINTRGKKGPWGSLRQTIIP